MRNRGSEYLKPLDFTTLLSAKLAGFLCYEDCWPLPSLSKCSAVEFLIGPSSRSIKSEY